MTDASYILHRDVPWQSAVQWARRNLFSSPLNGGLTIVVVWAIVSWVPPFVQWALIDATFELTRSPISGSPP